MAYNPHSMNDGTDDMSIPDLTANLDRQKKTKDVTPSIGSESDIIIPVQPCNFTYLKKILFIKIFCIKISSFNL